MTVIEVKEIGPEEMKVLEGYPAIVVFKSPSDYLGKYVARLWDIHGGTSRPTEIVVVEKTLKDVRERIRGNGLYPVPRMPDDDPCIVEVWI